MKFWLQRVAYLKLGPYIRNTMLWELPVPPVIPQTAPFPPSPSPFFLLHVICDFCINPLFECKYALSLSPRDKLPEFILFIHSLSNNTVSMSYFVASNDKNSWICKGFGMKQT
jgi:hypothetical protein